MRRFVFSSLLLLGLIAIACSSREASDVPSVVGSGGEEGTAARAGAEAGNDGSGGVQLRDSGTGGGISCDVDDPPPECFELVPSGPACGDGEINQDDEACDDGNSLPGDGCSGVCMVEPWFVCPAEGEPCLSTIVCGDGVLSGSEVCDDGNDQAGDGCMADCLGIEPGYDCHTPGQLCDPPSPNPCDGPNPPPGCGVIVEVPPACGDGNVDVSIGEECDDGNALPGDGCSGTCAVEPNFRCPTPGSPCESTIVCGNGTRDGIESCDDGNLTPGDGCDGNCRVEPGWYCPTDGVPCELLQSCGDGRVQAGEACDDGDDPPAGGDGCDENCRVEPGYRCLRPGLPCEQIPICGDGVAEAVAGEQCDDGNVTPGDGCNERCRVEAAFWDCPPGGGACTNTMACGNGVLEGTEECDDGPDNQGNPGDGCTDYCELQDGFICRMPGKRCTVNCGDGRRIDPEECDDGNKTDGDGCSSTCHVEPSLPTCGDGRVDAPFELCDLGADNGRFYGDGSGCSKSCTPEPVCDPPNPCQVVCGDGMRMGNEACDDGNLVNGDGCSSSCTVEAGYQCDDIILSDTEPCPDNPSQECLIIPITYRDFPGTHSDFDTGRDGLGAATTGLVRSTLSTGTGGDTSPRGKPEYIRAGGFDDFNGYIASAASFAQWYQSIPGVNGTLEGTLVLYDNGTGGYVNRWQGQRMEWCGHAADNCNFEWWDYCEDHQAEMLSCVVRGAESYGLFPGVLMDGNPFFFPVDSNPGGISPASDFEEGGSAWLDGVEYIEPGNHNFFFTSEARYLFLYDATEISTLEFYGDDDVWVFVNGTLAVDIGGIHTQVSGSVTISSATAGSYGLTDGNVYEIVVFHAERRKIASNYMLTLTGFQVRRSQCIPYCGNETATGLEECDFGDCPDSDGECNDGSYGGCTDRCLWAAFCGDGQVDTPYEECDNGINMDTVYTGPSSCAPGCRPPPHCGDGRLDPGEDCDDGVNDGSYGGCNSNCTLAPYCGDGIVNGSEECDDGLNIGGYGQCFPGCVWGDRCGDGRIQAGETCDDGNTVSGDGCDANCGVEGYCGDGVIQPELGESCDDGVNDGTYGHCTPDCQPGPSCGDGVVDPGLEECDDGVNDGGYGECAPGCRLGPYCGDGALQPDHEQCDDGVNDGSGECMPGCVIRISCGDGEVGPGEECDDGLNDGGYGECGPGCRLGPRCGDNVVQTDQGESCDDGLNDGGYGECFPGCRFGARCGDGEVQSAYEECDDGVNDGGYGECSAGCVLGPYCGDGTLTELYEECDDGNNDDGDRCSSACRIEIEVPI